ncbi:MAG: ywqD 2 [Verrucomicrobiales bacterium]|nr:ywqD 2 [Verrucomicrobiales bacterium]
MDSINTTDTPENKLHFLDYWRIVRMRKALILTVFFLVVITTTLFTKFVLQPQYASMVCIEVNRSRSAVSVTGGGNMGIGYDPYWIQTEFRKIESRSILDPVIEKLEFKGMVGLTKILAKQAGEEQWDKETTYLYLSRLVKVQPARNTSLIEIWVRNSDRLLAAKIANAIADSYKESRINEWRDEHAPGLKSLEEQVEAQTAQIKQAESNLATMRAEFGISEIQDNPYVSTTLETETIRSLAISRAEQARNYTEDSQIFAGLKKLTRDELRTGLTAAYPRQLDPVVSTLSSEWTEAEQKVTALKESLGEQNPEFKTAKALLERTQQQLDSKIDGLLAGLQQRVANEKASVQDYDQQIDTATKARNQKLIKTQAYPIAKNELESSRRQRDDLRFRVSTMRAEYDQPLQSIVVVRDQATPSPANKPVSPNVMLNIVLGVIVGLIVGIGLAFFIEYLDTSVKTIDDVERALQAPVLGVIPQHVGNLMELGADSPHAEAYRVLRTQVLFSRKDDKLKTLSVLSGGAGEGKSTTLFNLATIFAQSGDRVLVIDSDLRRPSIHKLMHVENTNGLTSVLLKQKSLEEVIQHTKIPSLDFIPSGKLPSSSMGILSSPQMKQLIQDVKGRYDFVFFDSPPLLGVSDASILASEMDMVLQVIQYRRYPQPMTIRAKQTILKVGGNLLGIVLNNINVSQDQNYYYYSGYYEYATGKENTVVKLSDAAPKVEIKQKY